MHRASIIIVARIAADRRQSVGRKRQETCNGSATRNVFDMRIQSTILVDDENTRKWPITGWLHEIPTHRSRCSAR